MDAKNDDSAGSDSLDKSLQKKCVVDDVGQGEGPTANAALAQGINDNRNDRQKSDTETTANLPANSINTQNKTEKSAGDGICDDIVLENNYRIDDGDIDGLDITNNDTNATTAQMMATYEAANANDDTNINNNTEDGNLCTHNKDSTTISNKLLNDAAEAPSENNINSNNSNCSSNNSNAFETKVKQISKNLKETTLAECANKKATVEDTNSTSSASSSSSASSTPECEQATAIDAATEALYSLGPSTSAAAAAAAAASSSAAGTGTQDEHDNRSKKVRFHPDVKENDGGNRVIPKKKKKLKTTQGGGASTSGGGSAGADEASGISQRGTSAEDDMELDEEEDEEEGIFSIAKTIEDAQDYLKEHPLTFAGSFDKSNVTTQSGLLEEEDLPQLLPETVADDEEEAHAEVLPENGVACILGKQIKCGKVEFLLRYIDRPGLYWETEEFIGQRCPNLLNQYEQCRERRQARLMNFVAKRQNLRQRYTDF